MDRQPVAPRGGEERRGRFLSTPRRPRGSPGGVGADGTALTEPHATKVGQHVIGGIDHVVGACLRACDIRQGPTPLDLEEATERERARGVRDRVVTRARLKSLSEALGIGELMAGSYFNTHEVGRLAAESGGSSRAGGYATCTKYPQYPVSVPIMSKSAS